MRHSAVDEMNGFVFIHAANRDVQSQVSRLGHLQRHQVMSKLGANYARRSFKRNRSLRARDLIRKTREAPRAVATHLRLAAIGVKITHPKIGAVGRFFEQQNSVGADAAMAIAKACDLAAVEMNVARAIVDQDEIVARAVHFCETQHPLSSSILRRKSQLVVWLPTVLSRGKF